MSYYVIYNGELYHHGVKGMKWGVRKDQLLSGRSASSRRTIRLGKSEYEHVMSELATNITREQRTQKTIIKNIANHMYTFENNFDNTYRVIGKKKIPDITRNTLSGGKKKW